MAQLMPLPLTVSCFSKIQIDFTFLVPAHPGSPGKRAVKCVCVCVCMCVCVSEKLRRPFVPAVSWQSHAPPLLPHAVAAVSSGRIPPHDESAPAAHATRCPRLTFHTRSTHTHTHTRLTALFPFHTRSTQLIIICKKQNNDNNGRPRVKIHGRPHFCSSASQCSYSASTLL